MRGIDVRSILQLWQIFVTILSLTFLTNFLRWFDNPCLPSNLLPAYLPSLFSQMVSYFLKWFQELEEGEGGRGRGGREVGISTSLIPLMP
jgi:hypothetical protein